MHLDVQDLRKFYYRRPLGRAVQSVVRAKILPMWPDCKGQTVAGFGFAVPFLRPFLPQARRVIALMPGPQGVMRWPVDAPNMSVLCEETLWPLETGHVDKLLVVHGLENSERPTDLLAECHRVLGPGGSVLFAVPNRAGLWSRNDKTPYGFGRPYSPGQLDTLLQKNGFVVEKHDYALFQPPSDGRFWRRTAPMWERIGETIPFGFAGGVLLLRASKRTHPIQGPGVRDTVRRPLEALSPKPKPVSV